VSWLVKQTSNRPIAADISDEKQDLVDQKNASWNRIARWLGRIEALRADA
jgi:hypothetical protein